MAAFAPANIPPSIDTVEKLFLWAGVLLHHMNRPLVEIEQQNGSLIPVADFYLFTDPDSETRAVVRGNIKIDPAYIADNSQKFWNFAEEFSQQTLPTGFTTD